MLKKKGPARYLVVTGRTREAVREIPAPERGGDDGLDKTFRSWIPYFLKIKVQEHTFHLRSFTILSRVLEYILQKTENSLKDCIIKCGP